MNDTAPIVLGALRTYSVSCWDEKDNPIAWLTINALSAENAYAFAKERCKGLSEHPRMEAEDITEACLRDRLAVIQESYRSLKEEYDRVHGIMDAQFPRIRQLEAELAGLDGEAAILAFARLLATKLHTPRNEAKGDWRKEEALDHWHGVYDEFVELTGELYTKNGPHNAAARWEAVDVALRAMMLCDVLGPLCDHDGRGRAKGDAQDEQNTGQGG